MTTRMRNIGGGLLVAILVWMGVQYNDHALMERHLSRAVPQIMRFDVEGADSVAAQYADADGVHLVDTIGGDILISGRLLWAVVSVAGNDITCYITVNDITFAASASDGPVNACVYVYSPATG